MSIKDTHLTIMPFRTVPDGAMAETKARFPKIFDIVKNGTLKSGKCLYYGFASHENTVFCREGYENAEGLFAHIAEMKNVGSLAGMKIKFVAPESEIKKLKEKFASIDAEYFVLDEGSMFFKETGQAVTNDDHVSIVPFFTVPEGKLAEFKSHFAKFYECTKNGTGLGSKQCLYYGFAINGNNVFCREGYTSAEGAMAHAKEVDEVLKKAIALVGKDNLDLSVIGPKAELDKLRAAFQPLGAKFFDLEDGSSKSIK